MNLPLQTLPLHFRAAGLLCALVLGIAACSPTEGETGKFDVVTSDNEDFDVNYVDVGSYPIQVAAGDIDGDGRADLVVSNRFSDDLTILTNGLEDPQTLATGKEPSDVVIADLDGRNGLDLAVVDSRGLSVTIYLNDGEGGWTQSDQLSFLGVITQLAAVDLNQDGSATKDLLFAVSLENVLAALVNDGNGNFSLVESTVAIGPGRFVTGLFSEDAGALDAAVLSPSRDVLSVLSGDGEGGFGIKSGNTIDTRLNPKYLTTLDVNGDGLLDLAVTSRTEQRVSVYRGSPDGRFHRLIEKKLVTGSEALVSGAFDTASDGVQNDLAVVQRNRHLVTILLWNDKHEEFDETRLQVHEDPFAIVKGDFNLDGCTDLAMTETDLRAMSFLAGDCTGDFTITSIGFSSGPRFPLVVDLDGDGGDDIVAVQALNRKLIVLRNVH